MKSIRPIIPYILFSAGLLLMAIVTGFQAANIEPALIQESLRQLMDKFAPLKDASSFKVFVFIFFNNTLIDLVLILSFFLFGLGALFVLLSNGLIIGIVLNIFGKQQGYGETIALLAPHGILEIPAFLIATGTSLWLSVRFLKKLSGKGTFREHFSMAMRIFFFWCCR